MCRPILLALVILWQIIVTANAFAATTPTFERRVWGRAEGAPQGAYGVGQDADGILWTLTVDSNTAAETTVAFSVPARATFGQREA